MDYTKLEYYLSKPRLNRFLQATGSHSKAQKLYRINLRVSQEFYPVLNLFEIFFRNTVYQCVAIYFSNPNWIITEKSGFMSDQSLSSSNYFLKKSVQKAERAIRRKGSPITAGKVVAEQSLGFWTSLYDPHHYRLVGGSPIQGFPNKPAYANRRFINQKLNIIREFRNRVYHNEPICFNNVHVEFSHAKHIEDEIYDLLNWIDSDLTKYVDYFNDIDSKINLVNKIFP
ncbi:MAG: hypothetical protein K9I68_00435 [Bacteroidales bacterium]|nr:hypothetical protein [Bacteroidales bacterium]MCF8336445.1 hypothetical protein [Bacteroidales bacterium]